MVVRVMPRKQRNYFEAMAPFDDPDDWDTDGGRLEDPETETCGGENKRKK